MDFAPEAMETMGPAMGESSGGSFLCLLPMGNASVVAATKNAVESVKADALINTVVDDERGFALLYCWQTIRVSGTAVKFKAETVGNRPARAPSETDIIQELEQRVRKR